MRQSIVRLRDITAFGCERSSWVILRMTPTALISYRICKKHEEPLASSTSWKALSLWANVIESDSIGITKISTNEKKSV
jgi:hypothetical protein